MAVLAVFLLLVLVGARACEQQHGGPGALAPTPTPPPSTTSAAATEAPPTDPPLAYRPKIIRVRRVQREKRRESPLYNYALLNSARLHGRGSVHSQREVREFGATVEFCACAAKLHIDAMRYREYGAVERWWIDCPEDSRELGHDDDDENRQRQPILEPSSSRPVSSAICNPLSESRAWRDLNRQSLISQIMDEMLTVLPSPLPPFISDIQPEASLCEGAGYTMENVNDNHRNHSVRSVRKIHAARYVATADTQPNDLELDGESGDPDIAVEVMVGMLTPRQEEVVTQQRQSDTTVEQDSSVQLPAATPEPQPGPSGVGRPPTSKPRNTSFAINLERDTPGIWNL